MNIQREHDRENVEGSAVAEAPVGREPVARTQGGPAGRSQDTSAMASRDDQRLLPEETLAAFQARWDAVQTGFVDDPRAAVRDAESLVNDMVERLTDVFTKERRSLEEVWSRGGEASTEDLRVALQRYRSFFGRLLAA